MVDWDEKKTPKHVHTGLPAPLPLASLSSTLLTLLV